jgi:hypothetical protein
MTALTTDRYVKELKNGFHGANYGIPGNAQFWYGQLLMQGTDDGLVKPVSGSTSTAANVVGISHQSNWLVSAATPLPTQTVEYGYGCFDFAADPNTSAAAWGLVAPGTILYALDTQTLSTGSLAGPVAGRFVKYQAGLQFPIFAEVGPLSTVKGQTV